MYHGEVAHVREILQTLSQRVPKIILQRVEETFPDVKKYLVSVLYQCVEKIMLTCFSLD